MSRDPRLWLQDILRACDRVLRYVGDRSREEALGDDLVHLYFALDHEIIWDAIQNDVPALRTKIRAILDES